MYLWRRRKLLEIKLCSRNLMKEIYTWAVALERYSKPFLKRSRKNLKQIKQNKTCESLRKGNLKREVEFLQLAAQNNAIRTNYIKARIDKTQQNCKCRLCGDSDETINHIINECNKLAQKEYKTRHDWVGKVIHWELCKKFNLTIRRSGICTTQNLSRRMRETNSSGALRYKKII